MTRAKVLAQLWPHEPSKPGILQVLDVDGANISPKLGVKRISVHMDADRKATMVTLSILGDTWTFSGTKSSNVALTDANGYDLVKGLGVCRIQPRIMRDRVIQYDLDFEVDVFQHGCARPKTEEPTPKVSVSQHAGVARKVTMNGVGHVTNPGDPDY